MYIPSKFNKIQYQLRDNNKRKIYMLPRVGMNSYSFSFGNENYEMNKNQHFYFYVGNVDFTLNTNPPTIYIATYTQPDLTFFRLKMVKQ